MKSLFLVALVTLTINAQAGSIMIYDRPGQSSYVTFAFEVNKDLGRAWVKMVVPSDDSESSPSEVRVKVKGMSLQGSSIVLDHEGQLVECATVEQRGRWITKRDVIIPTGRCEFSRRLVKVSQDNGFVLSEVERLQAFLTIQE